MTKAKLDAVAMLKADHRKVEDLFAEYKKARERKAEIAKQICLELTVHAMLEEELFYPACRDAGVDDAKLDEGIVEHDAAKVMIAEIESGGPDEDFYDAKVKVLSEEIEHHVKEEEEKGGIFAQAKSKGVDLEAVGEHIDARKKELMAQIDKDNLPPPATTAMKAAAIPEAPARRG